MNAAVVIRSVNRLFAWKVRGIRWIEIIGVLMVAAMIFSVYLAKAAAARESAQIADLERQIGVSGQRVRLLKAEVARLEQPGRLEALSRGAGLGPVDMKRQTSEADLAQLQPIPEPKPVVIVAPTPAVVPAAAPAAPAGEGAR